MATSMSFQNIQVGNFIREAYSNSDPSVTQSKEDELIVAPKSASCNVLSQIRPLDQSQLELQSVIGKMFNDHVTERVQEIIPDSPGCRSDTDSDSDLMAEFEIDYKGIADTHFSITNDSTSSVRTLSESKSSMEKIYLDPSETFVSIELLKSYVKTHDN